MVLEARTDPLNPVYNGGMDVVAKSDPSPRRTKRRGRHPDKALSAAFVRSAPPGRHADGNGLYLFVQPTGTRSWVQRLVIRGRRRELGLGAATLVPLAKAREQALANRMLARSGGDPLSEKRRVQGVPTFAEAAQRVLEQKRGGWRGRWHVHNWWRSMERYVFPRIGSRPVSEVNTADVLEILSPIWTTGRSTSPARAGDAPLTAGAEVLVDITRGYSARLDGVDLRERVEGRRS